MHNNAPCIYCNYRTSTLDCPTVSSGIILSYIYYEYDILHICICYMDIYFILSLSFGPVLL